LPATFSSSLLAVCLAFLEASLPGGSWMTKLPSRRSVYLRGARGRS
jgi:hypothetical protein